MEYWGRYPICISEYPITPFVPILHFSIPAFFLKGAVMSISVKIKDYMERASWIRKMFEQGIELKSKLGAGQGF